MLSAELSSFLLTEFSTCGQASVSIHHASPFHDRIASSQLVLHYVLRAKWSYAVLLPLKEQTVSLSLKGFFFCPSLLFPFLNFFEDGLNVAHVLDTERKTFTLLVYHWFK